MNDAMVSPIEWWPRERFQNRTNRVTTADERGGHTFIEETSVPIPDTEIVCDACNDDVDEFPCAVITAMGFALCSKCRKDSWHIELGDAEYFESMGYHMDEEPKKPRVNMGGRKR